MSEESLIDVLTVQDMKDWLDAPQTKVFMEYVRLNAEDCDKQVHSALTKNEFQEAALFNAGKTAFEDVQSIPEQIAEAIKDAKKEE